jgi:hypothetical protein
VQRIKLFLDPAFAAKLRDTMSTAGPQLVWSLDEKSLIGLLLQARASLTVPSRPPDQEGWGRDHDHVPHGATRCSLS